MKQILAGVYSLLVADDELKTLLEYNATTNNNILRFEGLKKYDLDTMLCFGKLTGSQGDLGLNSEVSNKIRNYDMQVQAFDRIDDINVSDIRERAIKVLHNQKLEEVGSMRSLNLEWERNLPIFYDNELMMYVGVSYYTLKIVDLS